MGNITEITTFKKQPEQPPIKKLTQETYLDLRTNEIKTFQKSENRAENVQSIRRSMARLRALINTNVTTPRNLHWVTLTYAENMTDTQRLYDDFRKFWQRFKYYCVKRGLQPPEYISVVEPQGRGAWHMHLILIWSGKAPYIDNDATFSPLWGHGFTKIQAVKNSCDNFGAYLTAYLADIPVDDAQGLTQSELRDALKYGCEIVEKEVAFKGRKIKKNIIKGGRLRLYPVGMNLFRASRGIKKPDTEWMNYETATKKVRSANRTFAKEYKVINVNDETKEEEIETTFIKEYYNAKRPKMQAQNERIFKNFSEGVLTTIDVSAILFKTQENNTGPGGPMYPRRTFLRSSKELSVQS